MPVSTEKWAVEIRDRHRRAAAWEPWGRDRGTPDPSGEGAGDAADDDWDLQDETPETIAALKGRTG